MAATKDKWLIFFLDFRAIKSKINILISINPWATTGTGTDGKRIPEEIP
jgi:hypothetical protein